jgi:hypothetical protein
MKYLKTYQLFESKTGLTPEQEAFLNEYTNGTWTYDSSTGLVDVEGDFFAEAQGLEDFVGVKFGKVRGNFHCKHNKLTRLAGAPQKVGGYFLCSYNKLTSLAGAPQEVGGSFICSYNELTSLEGAQQEVGRDFECSDNKLTSLAGAPQEVGEHFSCSYNRLTSLAGAPQEVGGYFNCKNNQLTSLEGAPQEVGGKFYCDAFELKRGEWNLEGWLKVMQEGSPKAQKLISTILSAETLNKEIEKDPAGMIMKLKGVWNHEVFKKTRAKLVWPRGYSDDADLVGDLDDVGF